MSAPVSSGQVVAGQALGRFAIAFVQGGFIMVGTALLFGVDWGNLWLSGLVLVLFCAVSAAAAMMVGSVMDNDTAAAGVGVGGGLVLAGLGGCMVPPEFFPETLAAISFATPHRWAYDALPPSSATRAPWVTSCPSWACWPVWPRRCSCWAPGSCGEASAGPCNPRDVPRRPKTRRRRVDPESIQRKVWAMANSGTGDSVVDRVVRVISAFPEGVTVLPLSELADRAGLPLSTAHRLVRQLAGHGLLDWAAAGPSGWACACGSWSTGIPPPWPSARRPCRLWRTSSRC